MQIFNNTEDINCCHTGSCVTIGNFDGVHKGHQRLLRRVRERAAHLGQKSVVITFEPHPMRVLTGKKTPPFITLIEQKLELLEQSGIDAAVCLKFTKKLASLPPEEFVQHYLVDGLHIKELIIGYDYAFGKGRAGNYNTLNALGKKMDFKVEQLQPVLHGGVIISSTRIRDMVESGYVWQAKDLLGRFYRIEGEVVHGQNRGGRLLGFPTANLCLKDELFPQPGVYAVWAEYKGNIMPAVANIGFNPTFGNELLSVEVHILGFKQDLYGKNLKVHFVQKLRAEKKFSGLDELKAQINEDIKLAQKILESVEAEIGSGTGQ